MIARNLSYQWGATVYVAAVSLGIVFALGRLLGPVGFGEYSYVLTVASLLAIGQDGGFRTLLFREGTAATPKLVGHSGEGLLALATGHLSLVTCVIVLLVALFAFSFDLMAAVGCFGLLSLAQFASARLKAAGRFPQEAAWQIQLRSASGLAIVALLFVGGASRPALVFAAWACGLAVALVLSASGRAVLRWPRWSFSAEIYTACLAFAVIDFATTVYFRIDILMLRQLTGDNAMVGYYSAIYRLFEGVILLATPVAILCFRELRHRWQDQTAFRNLLAMMVLGMFVVSLVVLGGVKWLGGALVDIAYGPAYTPAHPLLPWLFATLIFALPNAILTQAAIALNREKFYALIACGAAGVNVLFNLWLIPGHGIMGAIWATMATEAFLALALVGGLHAWLTAKA